MKSFDFWVRSRVISCCHDMFYSHFFTTSQNVWEENWAPQSVVKFSWTPYLEIQFSKKLSRLALVSIFFRRIASVQFENLSIIIKRYAKLLLNGNGPIISMWICENLFVSISIYHRALSSLKGLRGAPRLVLLPRDALLSYIFYLFWYLAERIGDLDDSCCE